MDHLGLKAQHREVKMSIHHGYAINFASVQ